MTRIACGFLVVAGLAAFVSQAPAHGVFKNALQEKYEFKSVSCNACHVKGEPKTERNDFGKAFQDGIDALSYDGMGMTAAYEAAKDKGDAEKAAFEEVMKEAFLEVLKEVETKESPSGDTWGDLLQAGSIDGIKKEE